MKQKYKYMQKDKIRIFALLLINKLKKTNNEEAIQIIFETLNELN